MKRKRIVIITLIILIILLVIIIIWKHNTIKITTLNVPSEITELTGIDSYLEEGYTQSEEYKQRQDLSEMIECCDVKIVDEKLVKKNGKEKVSYSFISDNEKEIESILVYVYCFGEDGASLVSEEDGKNALAFLIKPTNGEIKSEAYWLNLDGMTGSKYTEVIIKEVKYTDETQYSIPDEYNKYLYLKVIQLITDKVESKN